MTYQLRTRGDGKTEVVNVKTGQVRYVGTLEGARQAQAQN